MAGELIESRLRSAQSQFVTAKDFVTGTKGPFETMDEMVSRFRKENKKIIRRIRGGM